MHSQYASHMHILYVDSASFMLPNSQIFALQNVRFSEETDKYTVVVLVFHVKYRLLNIYDI